MLVRAAALLLIGSLPIAPIMAEPPKIEIKDGTIVGELGSKLDQHFTRLVANNFSGSVLVARAGEVVLAKGYGLARRDPPLPFTAETVFDIGSITKPFTAAAILSLEMDGKVKTADPITKYFTDVPADKRDITLHQLLTHTAGFVDSLGGDYERIGRDEFIRLALASKLRSKPGAAYSYSNVGYSLLAAIVELVNQKAYGQTLRERLLLRAGMQATGYVEPEWSKLPVAHGYVKEKDWGTPLDHAWAPDGPFWHLRGNGGLLSTVVDLYRWSVALETDSILSRAALEAHLTPKVSEGFLSGGSQYAYGWSVSKDRKGRRVIEHNGSNGIFFADLRMYPDERTVLILATNATGLKHMSELSRVSRLVLDDQ